jgi:hypothetical protein
MPRCAVAISGQELVGVDEVFACTGCSASRWFDPVPARVRQGIPDDNSVSIAPKNS